MAIPKESRTPELEAILAEFQARDLADLAPISDEQQLMLGKFIRMYAFIELNLRRALEFHARAGLLPKHTVQSTGQLKPYALVSTLKLGVLAMDPSVEPISDTLGKLDEIELRRANRNLYAHWAPIPHGPDHLVFMTRSDSDARQATGEALGENGVTVAISRVSDIKALIIHMAKYELWLAEKCSEWYSRYLV